MLDECTTEEEMRQYSLNGRTYSSICSVCDRLQEILDTITYDHSDEACLLLNEADSLVDMIARMAGAMEDALKAYRSQIIDLADKLEVVDAPV